MLKHPCLGLELVSKFQASNQHTFNALEMFLLIADHF